MCSSRELIKRKLLVRINVDESDERDELGITECVLLLGGEFFERILREGGTVEAASNARARASRSAERGTLKCSNESVLSSPLEARAQASENHLRSVKPCAAMVANSCSMCLAPSACLAAVTHSERNRRKASSSSSNSSCPLPEASESR